MFYHNIYFASNFRQSYLNRMAVKAHTMTEKWVWFTFTKWSWYCFPTVKEFC